MFHFLVSETVKDIPVFATSSLKDIHAAIGSVLRNASDWDGHLGKRKRISLQGTNDAPTPDESEMEQGVIPLESEASTSVVDGLIFSKF